MILQWFDIVLKELHGKNFTCFSFRNEWFLFVEHFCRSIFTTCSLEKCLEEFDRSLNNCKKIHGRKFHYYELDFYDFLKQIDKEHMLIIDKNGDNFAVDKIIQFCADIIPKPVLETLNSRKKIKFALKNYKYHKSDVNVNIISLKSLYFYLSQKYMSMESQRLKRNEDREDFRNFIELNQYAENPAAAFLFCNFTIIDEIKQMIKQNPKPKKDREEETDILIKHLQLKQASNSLQTQSAQDDCKPNYESMYTSSTMQPEPLPSTQQSTMNYQNDLYNIIETSPVHHENIIEIKCESNTKKDENLILTKQLIKKHQSLQKPNRSINKIIILGKNKNKQNEKKRKVSQKVINRSSDLYAIQDARPLLTPKSANMRSKNLKKEKILKDSFEKSEILVSKIKEEPKEIDIQFEYSAESSESYSPINLKKEMSKIDEYVFIEEHEIYSLNKITKERPNKKQKLSNRKKRKPQRELTEADKKAIAHQQQWKCARCNTSLPVRFEVHHIQEHSVTGNDHFTNLIALCPNCHSNETEKQRKMRKPHIWKGFYNK